MRRDDLVGQSLRWIAFVLVAVALIWALFILPRNTANLLLIVTFVVSMGYASFRYRDHFTAIFESLRLGAKNVNSFYQLRISPILLRFQMTISRAFAVGALLLMVASIADFSHPRNDVLLDRGFRLFFIGMASFWVAFILRDEQPVPEEPVALDSSTPPTPIPAEPVQGDQHIVGRLRRLTGLLGVAGFALMIEINGHFLGIGLLESVSHHLQFLLLLASLTALAWGFSADPWRRPDLRTLSLERRVELAFIVSLTLLALVVRVVRLDAIRVFVDEVNFMAPIRVFWYESDVPLLQPMSSVAAFPYIYPYLQSLTVAIFGRDLTGLRIISGVFGALTVPALYMLAKSLFNRRVAWVAAALLATFPLHMQFSRIGLNNIAEPLFGILTLALVTRGALLALGLRQTATQSPTAGLSTHFVLAGICFGLTQYFYEGGRLAYPAIIIAWLTVMLLTHWRAVPRRYIALFLAVAFIVAIPIYTTLYSMERPIAHRMTSVGLNADYWTSLDSPEAFMRDLRLRMRAGGLLFVSRAETSFYYAGDYGFLLPFLSPLLLLGIASALWYWRKPGEVLLILWVGVTLAAIFALFRQADSPRQMVIVPGLILLCALGLERLIEVALQGYARIGQRVVVVLVGGIMVMHIVYYFGVHIERFNEEASERHPGHAVALAAESLPPNTHAHIIDTPIVSQPDTRTMVEFQADGIEMFTHLNEEVTDEMLEQFPRHVNQAFYVMLQDAEMEALLRSHFDNLTSPIEIDNRLTPQKHYVLYFAPAQPTESPSAP